MINLPHTPTPFQWVVILWVTLCCVAIIDPIGRWGLEHFPNLTGLVSVTLDAYTWYCTYKWVTRPR